MNWNIGNIPELHEKIFVVTGGNTGIGFATVAALAEKRAKVILACRNPDKGNAALAQIKSAQPDADVTVASLDLASLASVKSFSERMSTELPHLDGLINNAGVMTPPFGHTEDGFETQFGTNVLGHFALTGRLLPLSLKTPHSRVVTMSSVGHWFGNLDFDNLGAEKGYQPTMIYAQSKLANLVFAHELQRRLSRAGAATISVGAHPGVTHSELGRNSGFVAFVLRMYGQTALEGALCPLRAAIDPHVQGGDYIGPGGFMTFKGPPTKQRSRRLSRDPELGARLWEVCQQMAGIDYL